MKIKAASIRPGMVINRGNKKRPDIELVIATEGMVEVEYTYYDLHDPYFGPLIGTIKGKEKVKVINGESRKEVIKKCLDQTFKRYFDAKKDIDTIRLIQAMDSDS